MKRVYSALLALLMVVYCPVSLAADALQGKLQTTKVEKTIGKIKFAFVFDGPSDKNKGILETFKGTISKSLLPDYTAIYDNQLVFIGDWSDKGAASASDKALNSDATMVISLGYESSMYLANKKDKKKYVVTIDEYGIRDFGTNFFNPVAQGVNDFILFKKLVPSQHKTAILMSENFYKTQKNWTDIIDKKLKEKKVDLSFSIIPVSNTNVEGALSNIPEDTDSVFVTPMFNLTVEQRKQIYNKLNAKQLPTFSSVGKDDVVLGAMLGTSTMDLDRKLAEATSFNIHAVLHGAKVKSEQIPFYEDKVIFINKDTAAAVGYTPPLRLLMNAEVITNKPSLEYNLEYVLNTLSTSNKEIERQKYLVSAARRSSVGSMLRYLPTLRMDLGYQSFNDDYARSYSNVPFHGGQYTIGMDQVIYSPDLVTNILIKNKKLKFEKAQQVMTEQNMGLEVGQLYLECLMLNNVIKATEDYVQETRANLAIARVREKAGTGGTEEVLRWAGKLSDCEQRLLNMKAEYSNIKIKINTMLYQPATTDFVLKAVTANDPAFYTKDLHVIDHVRNPEKLEIFTKMLVDETIKIAPETQKLRAAIAMKKIEMANYVQKFVLPDAKVSVEYGTQFNRDLPYEAIAHRQLAAGGVPWLNLNKTSGRAFIGAQWKPIEGGYKFAEIARCKSELNELNSHLDQVNVEIEMHVRETVNRAVAKYFTIEKCYKSMFAEGENYKLVKGKYLMGKSSVVQVADAQDLYYESKVAAMNSQYEFFKELIWVQRALLSVNWTKASPDAKEWVENIKKTLPAEPDFAL